MAARGCERNVITFGSLISAAERGGRCDIALRLWEEMRREGCRPNVVTFNGLLGACAQGEGCAWKLKGHRGVAVWHGVPANGRVPPRLLLGRVLNPANRPVPASTNISSIRSSPTPLH